MIITHLPREKDRDSSPPISDKFKLPDRPPGNVFTPFPSKKISKIYSYMESEEGGGRICPACRLPITSDWWAMVVNDDVLVI